MERKEEKRMMLQVQEKGKQDLGKEVNASEYKHRTQGLCDHIEKD